MSHTRECVFIWKRCSIESQVVELNFFEWSNKMKKCEQL